MQPVSYTRRALYRRRLSIDSVLRPEGMHNNLAVFGGTEDERIAVMMTGLRRVAGHYAIIAVHNSSRFENALLGTYRPVQQVDVGRHSFDPLIGITRSDAMDVRQKLHQTVEHRGMISIRLPAADQALQRMLASELTGVTYLDCPVLLVLFGIRQTENDPLINIAIGEHSGHMVAAIAGSSASRTVSQSLMPDMLQSFEEVLFLPTEDMQEAQRIAGSFGTYMRVYEQRTIQRQGFWPFRHRNYGISYQQTPTNNVDPIQLRDHTLICGRTQPEPILVSNLVL